MKFPWATLLCLPLVASCMVPVGYTASRAQGYASDSPSAQYLQLSLDYYQKGQELRTVAGEDESVLAEGLDGLQAEFEKKLDYVARGATLGAEIPIGDDTAIPSRSLAGVAMTEAMEGVSQGRALASASLDLEVEYQRVLDGYAGSRGLYLTQQSIWPENRVRWRWASASSPSAAHRKALLAAMAEWTRVSGGRVSFEEYEANAWNNFQLTIGVTGVVILQDSDLETGVTGRATVGYQCGSIFGYLKLNNGLTDPTALRRTTLHELGHVLGLLHEHKRPDRDQWIDPSSGGYSLSEADMGKVDEYVANLRWKSVQLRLGSWSITLYFPVWWKEKNAETVGTFDIRSVMIYSGFTTRRLWTDPSDGSTLAPGSLVPWNTVLSSGDGQAVKSLYP